MINAGKIHFPEGHHNGCLFHLKQAWRRRLISHIGCLAEEVAYAMREGILDLLTVIRPGKVKDIGIPFVRSLVEKNLDAIKIEIWDEFWDYIVSLWLKVVGVDSWNICLQDGQYKEIKNRTNNGWRHTTACMVTNSQRNLL